MADVVTLDTALDSEMSAMILKGKTMNIPFSSFFSQRHVWQNGAQIAMTRALTRIQKCFMTFLRTGSGDKEAQDLRYPSISADQVFTWQLQVASKKFPETAISSVAEYFMRLKTATGTHVSPFHNTALTLASYTQDSFILGIDLERVLSDDPSPVGNFSGLSTKAGDLLYIRSSNSHANIDTAFFVLQHSCILQLSEEGALLFD